MKVVREEIFGPVVVAAPFTDLDEIAAAANDSPYGLGAGIWTKDISKAHALAKKIRAGTVWINCYNVFDAALPFGGYKQSGWGREMGHEVLGTTPKSKPSPPCSNPGRRPGRRAMRTARACRTRGLRRACASPACAPACSKRQGPVLRSSIIIFQGRCAARPDRGRVRGDQEVRRRVAGPPCGDVQARGEWNRPGGRPRPVVP